MAKRQLTDEQRTRYSAQRRERYATDPDFRESRRRYTREWRENNPDHAARLADQATEKRLKEAGYTSELKRNIICSQGNACAICRVDFRGLPTKRVHADHCHDTKTPRGVLCHWCNTGLGGFRDDTKLLKAAIDYLEKYRGR